jgi:low temperature requirement protein LtrA
MPDHATRPSLLRRRGGHEDGRVTYIELFFDLVFVFAVTQLSHHLLAHLTAAGAFETLLLFMAVWWVWIYTAWVTNWLDPDQAPVRLLLLVLMLVGILLSTALPDAFGAGGLVFGCAYAGMQVGRSLFMIWAVGPAEPGLRRNFRRILAWSVLSGLFWLAGGLAEDGWRLGLWLVALLLEYASPSLGFRVPGLGRSMTRDWTVVGGHLAERCAPFIIIALGESILVTGATFGDLAWTAATVAAFLAAFVGSAAMWWLYFDSGAERGSHQISGAEDPGRLARVSYTYLHLPIVAGIVVAAVADEIAVAHPDGHLEPATIAALIGGPALFVLGTALFKRSIVGRLPLSHLLGLGALALLIPVAPVLSPLLLSAATTVALILIALRERISLGRPGRVPRRDDRRAGAGELRPPTTDPPGSEPTWRKTRGAVALLASGARARIQ